MTKLAEFLSLESFSYFFDKKYKAEYGIVFYLDTVLQRYDQNKKNRNESPRANTV